MPLDAAASPPADAGSPSAAGADLEARLRVFGLDPETCRRLQALRPEIMSALPGVLEAFYASATTWPEVAPMLGDAERQRRLAGKQMEHWGSLFEGRFDADTIARAVAIGAVHSRVGLQPRYYIGGYRLLLERMVAMLAARHRARPELVRDITAVLRASMLDMELALSAYVEQEETGKVQREMLAVSEVLERELSSAVSEISAQAAGLAEGADALMALARQVRGMTDAVGESIEVTAENVQTVASAAQELEASGREISNQVERALKASDGAVRRAGATAETVQALGGTATTIDGVVRLVQGIAGQTKLLALNATIEAARAGEAGRGFAVVATEVKSLARETESAIARVSAEAASIGRATSEAGAMMTEIVDDIGSVHSFARQVSGAAEQQREATAEITRSMVVAAGHTRTVAERARELRDGAGGTESLAERFKGASTRVSGGIADLDRRLRAILRSSHAGDRRREEREPVCLGFAADLPGLPATGHIADLSRSGMLLAVPGETALLGRQIQCTIDRVGPVRGTVAAVSELGVHLCFGGLDPTRLAAIEEVLAASRAVSESYIATARTVADRIAAAFEQGLAGRRISEADLFDTTYEELSGTQPQQYMTRSTRFCEALLPAIIDPVNDADPRMVFCIPTDRNGYLPVHNREYSQPPRPGDLLWNTAHCRNRRIFDDRTGLLAARNVRPFLVQAYPRDMGGGRIALLKEVDVPVTVRGRHWGAVRVAITF